jgi:hypothetical protein
MQPEKVVLIVSWRLQTLKIQSIGGSMPSKTPKQKRTMRGAAHNPDYAAKMGIPVEVAKEFNRADQAIAQKKKKPKKKKSGK